MSVFKSALPKDWAGVGVVLPMTATPPLVSSETVESKLMSCLMPPQQNQLCLAVPAFRSV